MKYLSFANRVLSDILSEILIMIIDLSASMDTQDWKPSRKAGAIEANKELIRVKAQYHPQDKVGIIGFGTKAEILHEPVCAADSAGSLCQALKNPPSMGTTNFTAALELAETCLFGNTAVLKKYNRGKGLSRFFSELLYGPVQQSSDCIKESSATTETANRIILLTDGHHWDGPSPLRIAQRLKSAGVIVDCIGIGGSPTDVDESRLKKIASCNPDGSIRYCFIGDQQDLIRKYESLAHHIRPV